jgi:hypothetical protein
MQNPVSHPNAKASLIHVPDVFGVNTPIPKSVQKLVEVFGNDSRLFSLRAIGIKLPLPLLEIAMEFDEPGGPVLPDNWWLVLLGPASPRA